MSTPTELVVVGVDGGGSSTRVYVADERAQVLFKTTGEGSAVTPGAESDSADVIGDLTIHGVTKEVPLHVKFLGKGAGMMGGVTTGWEAKATIKRSDFGLTWNKAVEGVSVVGDEVDIELEIEASHK